MKLLSRLVLLSSSSFPPLVLFVLVVSFSLIENLKHIGSSNSSPPHKLGSLSAFLPGVLPRTKANPPLFRCHAMRAHLFAFCC